MNYSTVILGVVLAFFGILFLLLIVYIVKSNRAKSGLKGNSVRMPPTRGGGSDLVRNRTLSQ